MSDAKKNRKKTETVKPQKYKVLTYLLQTEQRNKY